MRRIPSRSAALLAGIALSVPGPQAGAEPAQTADAICAALALTSVVLAVLSLLPIHLDAGAPSLRSPRPRRTGRVSPG